MTAVENTPEVSLNGTVDDVETPVEQTAKEKYFELVEKTWKLAYRLAYVDGTFCSEGTNEYLTAFGLPELVATDGEEDLQDSYLNAWFQWNTWSVTGDDEAHFTHAYDRLARAIRTRLMRNEPKPINTMNGWLRELGISEITPPVVRHAGLYRITYNESTDVRSARIAEALREAFPELNVEVSYERRLV